MRKSILTPAWAAWLFVIALFPTGNACAQQGGGMIPVQPRCESRDNPLGVDTAAPQLSWLIQATDPGARGLRQAAYQVLAASTPELLAKDQGDLWDSGKVPSDAMNQIAYVGHPRPSSATAFWKVRVWPALPALGNGEAQAGAPSDWSPVAHWTLGVLSPDDWQARWITAPGLGGTPKTLGYHAAVSKQSDQPKWVQVDLGRAQPAAILRLVPLVHDGHIGFGFPVRFKIETSATSDFHDATVIADQTSADFANPGAQPVDLPISSGSVKRHVRITATKLWARGNGEYCFALRQFAVLAPAGANLAASVPVLSLDSVEAYGWGRAGLTDGALEPDTAAPAKAAAKYASILLRRDFTAKPGLVRAVVHVCGLGHYELFINGAKVGDQLLAPGWSLYSKTCLYDSYDITARLRPGANATGIALGNGMYNVTAGRYTKFKGTFGPPKAIAQLRLEYADGTVDIVGTDAAWQVAPGPITFSSVYGGEDYDARQEKTGWDLPGLPGGAAAAWLPAALTAGPGGELKGLSCAAAPIKAFDELKPVSQKSLNATTTVYDLGQNASLMPRLVVSGPPGSSVRIIPSELLREDGSGDTDDTMCDEKSYWTYTLKGGGNETWFPQFFYRGGRYLKVVREAPAGGGALPVVSALTGVVVHSSSPPAGTFSCSNDLFNRTHTLVRWAQRSNLMSVITDCPQREKLGWLEQYHLNGPSLRYEWALSPLFTKGMRDMRDSQLANGFVPNIAPEYVKFGGEGDGNAFRNSPEWGSTFLLSAWQQYEFDGDLNLLRRYYDDMGRYVAYLRGRARDEILDFGLGDWYDIGPKNPGFAQLTPKALTATAFYYYDTWVLARTARLLGKTVDATLYDQQAAVIRDAFNKKFFNASTRDYATGSQCANSIPLVMDLVEEKDRAAVLANIVKDVKAKGLTAGDVGYRYLLRALADGGRSDVIFELNNQSEKPGYGYQLKKGATSLTEAWNALRSSSQNHFMLGQINEWFYHDLAGIQCDPAGPGFKKIVIRPAIVGDLTHVSASYDSASGKIICAWKRTGGQLGLGVAIPPNTTATVYVPARAYMPVRLGDQPAAQSPGVTFLRNETGCAVFEVGSGTYSFQTTTPEDASGK